MPRFIPLVPHLCRPGRTEGLKESVQRQDGAKAGWRFGNDLTGPPGRAPRVGYHPPSRVQGRHDARPHEQHQGGCGLSTRSRTQRSDCALFVLFYTGARVTRALTATRPWPVRKAVSAATLPDEDRSGMSLAADKSDARDVLDGAAG